MSRPRRIQYRTTTLGVARRAIGVGALFNLAFVPVCLAAFGDRLLVLWFILPVVGVVLFVVVLRRTVRGAPRSVSLDAEGIGLVLRRGESLYLAWRAVMAARHEVESGRVWRIEGGRGNIEFRDDGFTDEDWKAMRHRIVEECARREVPYSIALRREQIEFVGPDGAGGLP